MKFLAAWSEVASENKLLKVGLCITVVVSLALTAALCHVALQPALVVERGCKTSGASLVPTEHTTAEIEVFAREAITQRFDSLAAPNANYFAPTELAVRESEQKALATRKMTQRIVVNSVTVGKEAVTVDADRILAVGPVRSALPFPITMTVATTARSEANPYGLTIVKTEGIKPKEERK